MPVAYSYSRVSTFKQVAGFGLDRQGDSIEKTRTWCEANGLTLDESNILRDAGRSAFHGDHTLPTAALGQFVALVEAGKIERGSYLIVEHLNRLTREHIRRALALLLLLIDHGIHVVTFHDKRIYGEKSETLEIDLIVAILYLMDAHRSSKEKQRIASDNWEKKRKLARDGGLLTTMLPAWCSIDATGKIVENDLADVVRRIFSEVANGMGCWKVAKRLNDEGLPPLNGGKQKRDKNTRQAIGPVSKQWSVGAVAKLIQNDAPLGWYQPHRLIDKKRVPIGEPIKYYPPFIEQTLADRARARIASRRIVIVDGVKRPLGGRKGVHYSNLFTGMAKCGECGGTAFLYNYNAKRGNQGWLRCTSAIRHNFGDQCTNRAGIPYREVEQSVLQNIQWGLALRDQIRDDPLYEIREQLAQRRTEIEKIKASSAGIIEQFGLNPSPLVKLQIDRMEERHTNMLREIDELESRAATATMSSDISPVRWAELQLVTKMKSDEPTERYEARAKISDILRGIIDRVACYADRTARVLFRTWRTPIHSMQLSFSVYPSDGHPILRCWQNDKPERLCELDLGIMAPTLAMMAIFQAEKEGRTVFDFPEAEVPDDGLERPPVSDRETIMRHIQITKLMQDADVGNKGGLN
jgi:hypothetical protein